MAKTHKKDRPPPSPRKGLLFPFLILCFVITICSVQHCFAESGVVSCLANDATCQNFCSDNDASVCAERSNDDCDSDPDFMLIQCRKTCLVCLDDDNQFLVSQDAGLDKLPRNIALQVLRVIRNTNHFFQHEFMVKPEYALLRESDSSCRDRSSMCAFWAFRGQCTNPDYANYVTRECAFTCRSCVSDVARGRAFLGLLLHDLSEAYHGEENNVLASREASLSLLMKRLGMEPSVLHLNGKQKFQNSHTNWALELHFRLFAVIPQAIVHLYKSPSASISDDDFALLAELHGFPFNSDRNVALANILIPYRGRGYILRILQDLDHLITRPIQLLVGFAIPNEHALQRIKEFSKGSTLLYMGAGSGYWAVGLRQKGVDVLAYDLHPPMKGENLFFDSAYIEDIQPGSCQDALSHLTTHHEERTFTLLLVWPNDPDPIDNRRFCGTDCDGSEAVWDAACLDAYRNIGARVVYVGERESRLSSHISPDGDSGLSSTRRFQQMLLDQYSLVETIELPCWWLNEDDLTLWEREK